MTIIEQTTGTIPDYTLTIWVNAVAEFISDSAFVYAHFTFALMYFRITERLGDR
jgi:hypothetical protein